MAGQFHVLMNEKNRRMAIEIEFQFMSICPVPTPMKGFSGTIVVTYVPDKWLVEWDSMQEWLKNMSGDVNSAEDFIAGVADVFMEIVKPCTADFELLVDCAFHLPVYIHMSK